MLVVVILPVAIRAVTPIAVILLTWRLIVLVLLGLSPALPVATISSVMILHRPSVILTVPEPSMLLLSSVERWDGSSAELLLTLPNLLHVVIVVIVRLLLDWHVVIAGEPATLVVVMSSVATLVALILPFSFVLIVVTLTGNVGVAWDLLLSSRRLLLLMVRHLLK